VFAGAAREAVFSNAEVIQRVNADFVPVALKAALVNNPPGDDEGLLYREIARSMPAPQGICVINSAGKVLTWALMFDDDKSLLAFFDQARQRYEKFPDAKKPVAAEVYIKFPSLRQKDVEDSGKALPVLDRHPEGKRCPAELPLLEGTVVVRLVGRALDRDGKPVADTLRQENYIEDRFYITIETQHKLAAALTSAGKDPVELPLELTRPWVRHAHLGVLDVQPLDNPSPPGGSKGELKRCSFSATKVGDGKGPTLWRVEGESEAFIDEKMANGGPGDMHEVKLKWQGFIEIDGNRMTRLVLSAGGREKLKWQSARGKNVAEVAILPGGHPIDLDCAVRFGLLGEAATGPGYLQAPAQDIPEEARRQVTGLLGSPFLVFRDKVQEDLQLSKEQKEKLDKHLQDTVQETMQFVQKLGERKPEERDRELQAYREKAQEKLSAVLRETLTEDQHKRLWQVVLQKEGLFALGHPDIMKELELTGKQHQQFIEVVQAFQKAIEPLMKEGQKGGKPEEIHPKAIKIRKHYEEKIEAILSDAQKQKWKEFLGKPLDLKD
jgi:hypothetical protein